MLLRLTRISLPLAVLAITMATPMPTRAACDETTPTNCSIGSAGLEINLGPFPVDYYFDHSNNRTPAVLPTNNCLASSSVRDCIIKYLKDYKAQKVTGVRFQLGLGGGGDSTAFDYDNASNTASPTINRKWLNNLRIFFRDLSRTVGIKYITPTPVLSDAWSAAKPGFYSDQFASSCRWLVTNIEGSTGSGGLFRVTVMGHGLSTGDQVKIDQVNGTGGLPLALNGNVFTITIVSNDKFDLQSTNFVGTYTSGGIAQRDLRFIKWLPYGHSKRTFLADCQDVNDGYDTAAANASFWGWQPLLNLMGAVLVAAKAEGLTIRELDMENELNLLDFTVQGRLIRDNTTSPETDVLADFSELMDDHFGEGAGNLVTYSTLSYRPNTDTFDCGSVYGDTAMIMGQSELTAAIGGVDIGIPGGSFSNSSGLPCGGSTTGMFPFPTAYAQPSINDFHAYPLTSVSARNYYNGVWTFLDERNFEAHTAMIGEATSTQNCDNFTPTMAYANVNGFNGYNGTRSTLFQNAEAQTIFRPWENMRESCYIMSNTIAPPYNRN